MLFNWTPRHKAYWGSGGIIPRILDLGTRWRWVVSITTRPLYPQGKSPSYPLCRRLRGPQSWPGRGGKEINFYSLLAHILIVLKHLESRPNPKVCGIYCRSHTTSKYSAKTKCAPEPVQHSRRHIGRFSIRERAWSNHLGPCHDDVPLA
jgi:hypothetical protein